MAEHEKMHCVDAGMQNWHSSHQSWTSSNSIWTSRLPAADTLVVRRRTFAASMLLLDVHASVKPIARSKFIFRAITTTKITILHANAQKAAREAMHVRILVKLAT